MTEHVCGNVHRAPVPAIADRAARHVLAYSGPRAVALDPDGGVVVEAPHTAAEADVLGVYTASLGILELTRRITEDLRHEVQARAMRPQMRRQRATVADATRARQPSSRAKKRASA